MRRHPLIRRAIRAGGGALLAAALLVGCGLVAPASPRAPATVGLTITSAPGERLAFEPAETTIAAPGPVRLRFENRSSLAHNLVFTGALTAATRTIVNPGTGDELALVLPAAGRYRFVCTIHEGMSGSLIVDA